MNPDLPLTALASLRQATRPMHDRIETVMSGLPISESTMLAAHLRVHGDGLSRALDSSPATAALAGRFLPLREYANLIHDDHLALTGQRAAAIEAPHVALETGDDPAAGLGIVYVVTGSFLGLRALDRMADGALSMQSRYIHAVTTEGVNAWQTLLRALRAHDDDPASCRAICRAATTVFQAYLSRSIHELTLARERPAHPLDEKSR